MFISRLALDHFRSWEHCVVDFEPGITLIQGANGLGKTNLVEAIEVLSTGSSHRTSSSLPLIERGASLATIRANVENNDLTTTYEVSIRARGANRGRINNGSSLYMRDIVGKVPSVFFTPDDQRCIAGEPSVRRTFINQACSMLIPGYTALLQQYEKIAKQRAALLKRIGTLEQSDQALLASLEVWTGQCIESGIALTRHRAALIAQLNEPLQRIYQRLAQTEESLQLQYNPSFAEVLTSENPSPLISQHFQRIYAGEVARGINLLGPQRDDVNVLFAGVPAREFASNGEMWTMALALKMALHELLIRAYDEQPIVILDDVFAQLDESRREQILEFARAQQQVIITVAAQSDIPQIQSHDTVIHVKQLREASQQW